MKNPNYSRYSYCLLFCLQAVSQAAEIPKKANNDALNLGSSWDAAGAVPGVNDVMLWNSTVVDGVSAATSLPTMGGDFSVAGIKETNVGGTRNQALRMTGFQNPASANTLTLGALGIDLSTATQTFVLQPKILLGANQTWTVGDANNNANPANFNNNEDLLLQGLATATPFNLNGKTLTTNGAGQITVTAGYTISNGTVNNSSNLLVFQGGSNLTMNILSTVNLNAVAGRLRIQNNSGAGGVSMVCAAPVTVSSGATFELRNNNGATSFTHSGLTTLNAGSTMTHILDASGASAFTTSGNIVAAGNATWRVTGTANPTNGAVFSGALSGSGNIAYQNTATAANGVIRMTGNNSAYAGTITLNGASGNRSLRLASANAGSAAATWEVGTGNILQSEGLAVQLGTLNGAGTVTNTHASNVATYTIGAGNFAGGITNNGLTTATAVTKTGPGTLVLSGPNNWTGATTVSQGTLVDNPDHVSANPGTLLPTSVTVADGATYGVLVKTENTTLGINNLSVGTTTGGSVQFDFGSFTNPASAPLAVNGLFFHGPSSIKVIGKNLTTGTFPLLQYTAKDPGSTATGSLGLILPTRTSGTLSDDGSIISLNISATQQVKWNGDVNNNWDIDPDGTGAVGTPNWLTTSGNVATRYIQGTAGTDAVNFTDSASGGTEKSVNLTATMSPSGLTFNNSAKNYTLGGPGKLSGVVALEKKGTGMVTLANTTPNDYSGGTVITEGTLRLGDGVISGAGQISGAILNEGRLILNRADNFDFTNALSGAGTFEKAASNTVSFPSLTSFGVPVVLTAGKLKFNAGGVLSGSLSGSGELEAAGGNLDLAGSDPNTNTGNVTVSSGALRLMKPEGVNAVGGDIYITGTGTLAIMANEQIPNTATIHALGTSVDSLINSTGTETYANAEVNGVATTQLIMRNSQTITGTGTITHGLLVVASAHTGSIGSVVMNSADSVLRIAAGSAASVMNIGAGGITASAGEVQVKFNANDQDATLNLAGNLTTTGNFSFTNAGYGGGNLNVVNLSGSRVFNIGSGTTTTFAPDLAGATVSDSLTKSGGGTLTLNASCAANILGGTAVDAGTLLMNGSISGGLVVNPQGTLGGTGSIAGSTAVNGGTVAPGAGVGALTSSGTVTFGPDSDLAIEIGSWTGTTAGTDWDVLNANTLAFTATPSNPLVIHVSGTPAGFSELGKTMVIGASVNAVTGFDASAIQIDAGGFTGSGTWSVQLTGNNVELVYTAGFLSPYDSWATAAGLTGPDRDQGADPDKDGQENRLEFALSGDPASGKGNNKVVSKIASVGGQQALTLTLPVRSGVSFSAGPFPNGAADGINYAIQADTDLDGDWNLGASEVTGADATAIQTGLPVLPAGWTYHTFRATGQVTGDAKKFIRVVVNPAA